MDPMSSRVPELKCALCDKPVDARDAFFRASGDFLPEHDSLTPFCNVPLHWACYGAWAERPRFARHYVEAWVKANRKNPFWWTVYQDERVYVSANPERPTEEAAVRLYAVGSDIRVPLVKWARWVADPEQVASELQAVERAALAEVLPLLRERYPDDHAVVDAIDPDEKRPGGKQKRGKRASAEV